ncbi:iron ABC transporter substrate-binding protein [Intrasporangium calvum]|uniref:Extracellular solute-binding protein family 1 n=1 Tax=Intrasporangium calvum (strain ATCC 23552 / DSM 43043 / JCM 3097 / NBRC 12989 / NCIMB 10167 / NRRL B-3866 / 7 KIP) TaxID=710696 RepID=E6SDL2_INTC7|nr:iron ABC transporter substrate-binding protein [Intrasporangium calvum]ADU48664.1 extracellular solute-binding protein family 1 [Intrasporangium calvum DSM 43043]AXG13663.1 iron ABC transporter substrate-binding protein [Intrasporangium calvum]
MHLRRILSASLAAIAVLGAAACGSDGPADTTEGADLVIYSGRSESLVKGILDDLAAETGVKVGVRYAGSSELAAQLLEEGDATKADVFFSQDAGALGALAKEGRLEPLDAAVTDRVIAGFADPDGHWVGTSARARVIAYNPQQAPEVEQMTSVDAVLDPKYKGKIGYAPANASFHAFVTALRVAKGEDGAREWLTKFKANEPRKYDNNILVLDGVDKGEVALGLINHYYWFERVAEKGADAVTARIHFLGSDDPGALINVAGVGILKGTDQKAAALKAVNYLLSEKAQKYFADQTAEYPVVAGVTSKHDLPPLADLEKSSIDLNKLDSLETTLALLNEVGLT